MKAYINPSAINHKNDVNVASWETLSLLEQLGNVAMEVVRANRAWRSEDQGLWQATFLRALNQLDTTIACLAKNHSPRLKEIVRAREMFCALYFCTTFEKNAQALENYFLYFAFAARKNK